MPDPIETNQPPKPPADIPKTSLPKANVATPANKPAASPPTGGVAGTQPRPSPNTVVNRPSSPTGTIAPSAAPLIPPGTESPTRFPPNPSPTDVGERPRETKGASPDTSLTPGSVEATRPSTQFPSTPTQVSSTTPMVPPVGTPDFFDHGRIDFNDQKQIRDALDKYVAVEELPASSQYTHKGVCRKCGWQSHQYSEADARESVFTHAQKHLREVR